MEVLLIKYLSLYQIKYISNHRTENAPLIEMNFYFETGCSANIIGRAPKPIRNKQALKAHPPIKRNIEW